MNKLVRKVMVETVRQARELSRIVEDVPHAGLRGQFRESFPARALRPWLPRGMELGTGVIVDEKAHPGKSTKTTLSSMPQISYQRSYHSLSEISFF